MICKQTMRWGMDGFTGFNGLFGKDRAGPVVSLQHDAAQGFQMPGRDEAGDPATHDGDVGRVASLIPPSRIHRADGAIQNRPKITGKNAAKNPQCSKERQKSARTARILISRVVTLDIPQVENFADNAAFDFPSDQAYLTDCRASDR